MYSGSFLHIADIDGLKRITKEGDLTNDVTSYGACTAVDVDDEGSIYASFGSSSSVTFVKYDKDFNKLWSSVELERPVAYVLPVPSVNSVYCVTEEYQGVSEIGRFDIDSGNFYGTLQLPNNPTGISWWHDGYTFISTKVEDKFDANLLRVRFDGLIEDRWRVQSGVGGSGENLSGVSIDHGEDELYVERADGSIGIYQVPERNETLTFVNDSISNNFETDTDYPRFCITPDHFYHCSGGDKNSVTRHSNAPQEDIVTTGISMGGVSVGKDEDIAYAHTDNSVFGSEELYKINFSTGVYNKISDVGNECYDIAFHPQYDADPYSWKSTDNREDYDENIIVGHSSVLEEYSRTGSLRWRQSDMSEIVDVTFNSSGVVFASSEDNAVYCYDTDGTVLWSWEANSPDTELSSSNPSKFEYHKPTNSIYVCGTVNNNIGVYKLDIRDGRVEKRYDLGRPGTAKGITVTRSGKIHTISKVSGLEDGVHSLLDVENGYESDKLLFGSIPQSIEADGSGNVVAVGKTDKESSSNYGWYLFDENGNEVDTGPSDKNFYDVTMFPSSEENSGVMDVSTNGAKFTLVDENDYSEENGDGVEAVSSKAKEGVVTVETNNVSGTEHDVSLKRSDMNGDLIYKTEISNVAPQSSVSKISAFPRPNSNLKLWTTKFTKSIKTIATSNALESETNSPVIEDSVIVNVSVEADVTRTDTQNVINSVSATSTTSATTTTYELVGVDNSVDNYIPVSLLSVEGDGTADTVTSTLKPSVNAAEVSLIENVNTLSVKEKFTSSINESISDKQILSTTELKKVTTSNTISQTEEAETGKSVTVVPEVTVENVVSDVEAYTFSKTTSGFTTATKSSVTGISNTVSVLPTQSLSTTEHNNSGKADTVSVETAISTTINESDLAKGNVEKSVLNTISTSVSTIFSSLNISIGSNKTSVSSSNLVTVSRKEYVPEFEPTYVNSEIKETSSARKSDPRPVTKNLDSNLTVVQTKITESGSFESRVQSYGEYNTFSSDP